ncbi:MAG: GNAT family N-acetyltransferase [Planctomycetes bacterium]|nr:GNAT family N-acetyltransferase [Planctomycetota bacterium]
MSAPSLEPRPVELHGSYVTLAPLREKDAPELASVACEPSGWDYMSRGPLVDAADARAYIAGAWSERHAVLFGIREHPSGRLVGVTRFFEVRPAHRGLEIGHTWLAPAARRRAINTAAKRLLLAEAFESLGALRVQMKTDARNLASQRAIERLGATKEGVLRQHMIVREGYVRDTVMYSIVADEWPALRARLDERLARGPQET